MRTLLLAMTAAIAAPAALAFADDDDHRDHERGVAVSREEAIEIARSVGLATLDEIELDDGDWEIEGYTADGREIDVEIDARTGEIEEVDIDDD